MTRSRDLNVTDALTLLSFHVHLYSGFITSFFFVNRHQAKVIGDLLAQFWICF